MFTNLLSVVLAVIFPRFLSAILWLFTSWFTGVFETRIWPILGFFFLPTTMLWYSAVQHWYGGEWSNWRIAVVVLAVLIDLSRNGYTVQKGNEHKWK